MKREEKAQKIKERLLNAQTQGIEERKGGNASAEDFSNLGPRTHMSGQIGVPSILGGSQNVGDPPLRNYFCCCYAKE